MIHWIGKHSPLLRTAGVLAVLFAAASLRFDGFCSPYLAADLLSDNAFLGIAALGMTLVIVSGGIDLSVGSVIGFTSIFVATLITDHQLPPLLVWALALAIGASFGVLMGWLIQAFELPAFLITLAGMFFARGMAFVIKRESVQIDHPLYDTLGGANLAVGDVELTFGALAFLGMYAVSLVITNLTRFGRDLYSVGGNEESALLMGVPVGWRRIGVYGFSGFCAAAAGIVMTLYMDSGNPANASGIELDVIAVVVIGGTLLTGGVGSTTGTVLGVLIYGVIYQVSYFANLPSSLATIAIGVLLLASIGVQRVFERE